jgi:hypothetical protein
VYAVTDTRQFYNLVIFMSAVGISSLIAQRMTVKNP